MGLFIWDPLSNILSSPRLFINRYPFKTVYKPVKSIHKSWKTRNKSLRTVNNLRQLEPHRPVQKEPSKIHDESKAKHVSIKCNSGDNILLDRTFFFIIYWYVNSTFYNQEKTKPSQPCSAFKQKEPSRGSYESKAGHVLAVWPQTWDVFGHCCIVLWKKQRVEMTAAERNSVLTFRLVRTA